VSYVKVGGVKADLPTAGLERLEAALPKCLAEIDEVHKLLTRNRIFVDRVKDVGIISKEDAWSMGFTGPVLRSIGVPRDLRKDEPYLVYDRSTSMCRSDRSATITIATWCAWKRCGNRCASSQCIKQIPKGAVRVDLTGRPLTGAEMVDRRRWE